MDTDTADKLIGTIAAIRLQLDMINHDLSAMERVVNEQHTGD